MENNFWITITPFKNNFIRRFLCISTTFLRPRAVRYLSIPWLIVLIILPTGLLGQTISWTGNGDGVNWNQAANWNENRVPGADDDVIVSLNGTYTIEQTGGVTINSLTFGAEEGVQTLRKTASTFTINAESELGPNAVLIMEAGNLQGDGTLTNEGTLQITPSNWTGILELNLINQGTVEHESGIFYLTNATLENQGRYEVWGGSNIFRNSSFGNFINSGELVKTQGEQITRVSASIDSRPGSSIESVAGTLQIESASSYHNTTFIADQEDATVRFESGRHTFRGEITGNPVGLVLLNGASESHDDGATLNFGGTGLTWESNYLKIGGTVTNVGRIRLTASNWTGIQGDRFINEGIIDHVSGIFYLTNGIFENRNAYNIRGDLNIFRNSSFGNFINNGDLLKTEGEGTARISAAVDSRPGSTIESVQGVLQMESASSYHNTTFVADQENATVRFASGRHAFRGIISGSPIGTILLDGSSESHEDGATFNLGGTGLTWASNYMHVSGTVTNAGHIRLLASNWTGVQGDSFINDGTIDHLSGIFYLTNGIFENRNLYNIRGDVNIFRSSSFGNFINNGDLIKTDGDGLARISVSVDSRPESTIESVQGTLQIESVSSYHNTTFVADQEEASIRFETGRHTFRGDISGNPVGQIVLNGPSDAHEEGAILNFGGTGLTWTSNYMTVDNSITNTGLIRMESSNWTGIQGDSFINNGTVDHLSGIFYLTNAIFENRSLYNVNGDVNIFRNSSFGTFINAGRFIKTAGTGKSRISAMFDSRPESIIESNAGTIQFEGNGDYHNTALHAQTDESSIRFETGIHTFRGNFTEQPVGSIIINSEFKAHDEGVIFNITGTGLTWTSSYFSQGGQLQNEGLITLDAPGFAGLNNSTLVNNGQMLHLNGTFNVTNSAYLLNNNDFEFTGDFSLNSTSTNPGLFDNMGTFRKTGGEGISFISSDFINQPQSLFDIESGQVQIRSDFTLEQNALMRSGEGLDIGRGAFFNKGIFELTDTVRTFNYVGDYEPNDTSAVLDLRLGIIDDILQQTLLHVQQADYRINFRRPGGNATLAGKLNLTYEDDFIPMAGQEFEIIRTDIGMTGGFSSYTGLVDLVNQRSYYPQVRDTSLFLVTSDAIPSLSGPVQGNPLVIQAGEQQMITFTGTGFPPDLSVELTCRECIQPEMFGTITGRVGSISPDTAVVWFDVSNPLITGTYDAVLTDPRGVQESLTIQINQGPPSLSVLSIDPVDDVQSSGPGKLIIQADRILDQDLSIPVTISGSARVYEDYVSDFSGSRALIQSGSDRFVMNVFPTSNSESDGPRTVSLSISSSDDYSLESSFSSVTILPRPQTADFDIYALSPSYGGTGGTVTSEIVGTGISPNATVRLVNGGSEIFGTNINVRENGSALTATFQLSEAELGFWSVILTNEGGESKEINQGFSVVNHVRHSVVADIIAPPRVARGRNNLYKLSFRNTGNNDVLGIPGLVGLPAEATWEIVNRTSGDTDFSFDDFVTTQLSDNNRKSLRFWPMRIPPGATVNLDVQIAMPNTGLIRFRPVWFGS